MRIIVIENHEHAIARLSLHLFSFISAIVSCSQSGIHHHEPNPAMRTSILHRKQREQESRSFPMTAGNGSRNRFVQQGGEKLSQLR
jgi:hypothetical protein